MNDQLWNWPNRLTVARLFLAAGFVAAISGGLPRGNTVALLLFAAASVTDWVDGHLARRLGLVTDFGKLMDPLADKVLIAAAFICLVPLGAIPAWVVVAIVGREFLITGLRLLALTKAIVLPAEAMGKHKTVWQAATALFFLVMLAAQETFPGVTGTPWWPPLWDIGGAALIGLTVGLTLFSGVGYFWRHRDLVGMR